MVMNWEAVSALSEATGMVAVVISIIYLAIQIRLGRVWSKKQAFEGYLALLFGWFSKISTDENTARLYNAGRASFHSLSDDDRVRFAYLMLEKFACLELLREYDKDQLSKRESMERIPDWIKAEFAQPGIREWWVDQGSKAMASDFVTYVNAVVSETENS